MRADVDTATERIIAARLRLAAVPARAVRLQEVEDVLCEGYAQALAADAWLMKTEGRLHELIDDASLAARGRDIRSLSGEHGRVQRSVMELRRELAALRAEHDRLRTRSHASSA